MKKRVFCFLTAAVMLLLLLPAPALACDHTDEDGEPLKYVKKGYVAPQIGKPGYSGDLCCPKCGAVVIPGAALPALEEPAGPSGGSDPMEKPKPQATAKPKATKKPAPKNPSKPAGSTAVPESVTAGRERFSPDYPYRRVRMQPSEGIRAEAAGILVWPAAASPFQRMFD